jgi:hypothetical protein
MSVLPVIYKACSGGVVGAHTRDGCSVVSMRLKDKTAYVYGK